jgi:hypothetical protein
MLYQLSYSRFAGSIAPRPRVGKGGFAVASERCRVYSGG